MAKREGFIKSFMIIGSGTLINMLLGLLTTPIITRLVDTDIYGQFSIFTMYSTVALTALCLGLDQSLMRFYYENDSMDYKRALLKKCTIPAIIATLFVSVAVILLAWFGLFEFSAPITVLLCAYTLVQVIFRFVQLVVRLEHNSKIYSFLNVLHKAAYILFIIPTAFYFKNHYFLILIFGAILSVLTCVIVGIIVERNHWKVFKSGISACEISEKEILKYAYPFIISMGVTSIFDALDKFSLDYYWDYSVVGVYASAISIISVFAIIRTTFNTLWAPMAVERFTKDPSDKAFHQHGNQIITVIMFAFGLTLILAKDVFALLLGAKYREAAYLIPFLALHPMMYSISETTIGGLVFYKKSKLQVVVAVVSCLTNLVGNTLLVPILQGKGAAISTGLSYIVFFTMRTFLAKKYFNVDFRLKQFYLLTLVTCLYAAYNTFVAFNVYTVLGYVVCILVLVVLYLNTVKEIFTYCINKASTYLHLGGKHEKD